MKIPLQKIERVVTVACVIVGIAYIYTFATHNAERAKAAAQRRAEIHTVGDVTTVKGAPADIPDNKRLLDAAQQLAAANEWCRLAFSDLNRHKPLNAQQRDDLQNCLWVRYVSEQASQGTQALDRAQWEQKTQLDARAADSQLVAAWQYPRTVRGPQ